MCEMSQKHVEKDVSFSTSSCLSLLSSQNDSEHPKDDIDLDWLGVGLGVRNSKNFLPIQSNEDSDADLDTSICTSSSPSSSPSSSYSSSESSESLALSSDWETDEVVETISKTALLSPQEDDPGYIPLWTKVGECTLINRKKQVRFKDEQRSRNFRQLWKEGGDLDDLRLPIPLPDPEDGDDEKDPFQGIRSIGKILNNPELTISQKYKSLGVEEDLHQSQEDDDVPCSCWGWLKYKISQVYGAQWPLLHFPEDIPPDLGQILETQHNSQNIMINAV